MKSYVNVTADIRDTVREVLSDVCPDLARVRFAVVGVESDTTQPDAVSAKILGPVARAAGAADVALLIDLAQWEALDAEARAAWVDAAVAGLRVAVRDGSLVVDMADRPLVRRRRPDFRVAAFRDVVTRRGHKAPGAGGAVGMVEALRATVDPRSRSPRGRVRVAAGTVEPESAFG